MTDEETKQLIQKHEGYRDRVYLDSVGVPTVGWGHALHTGSKISKEVAETLFEQDFKGALEDYKLMAIDLDPVRRAVILDMLFNLGILKLKGFKNTLRHLRSGNYEATARHMLKSKWARQVGPRAKRLAKMMETGEVGRQT